MFRSRHHRSLGRRALEFVWPRMGWPRTARYVGHRVGRLPATPHAIAAGFASGVAVSMTPMLGLHILLGFGVAWLLRGSMLAAAIGTVVGNPWTFPAIWYVSYELGCTLTGMQPDHGSTRGLTLAFLLDQPFAILLPMMIGGIVMALVAGPATYIAVRWPIAVYQRRRAERRARGWRRPPSAHGVPAGAASRTVEGEG